MAESSTFCARCRSAFAATWCSAARQLCSDTSPIPRSCPQMCLSGGIMGTGCSAVGFRGKLPRLRQVGNGFLRVPHGIRRVPVIVALRRRHLPIISHPRPCAPQFGEPQMNVGKRRMRRRTCGCSELNRVSNWRSFVPGGVVAVRGRRVGWRRGIILGLMLGSVAKLYRPPGLLLEAVTDLGSKLRSSGRVLRELDPPSRDSAMALRRAGPQSLLKVALDLADRLNQGDAPDKLREYSRMYAAHLFRRWVKPLRCANVLRARARFGAVESNTHVPMINPVATGPTGTFGPDLPAERPSRGATAAVTGATNLG
jgi:hypothetical protein